MRRFGWRGLATTLAVACLVLGGLLAHKSAEYEHLRARTDTLYQKAKVLEGTAAARKHQVDSLSARLPGLALSPIDPSDLDRLRERGLEHPVQDLTADLTRHPEIIPYPGVLGGQMGFNNTDRIRVLNDTWVYAPFEDGHVAGDAILSYQVALGGAITWRVVASRMLD